MKDRHGDELVMPLRSERDGEVKVERPDDDSLLIYVVDSGQAQSLTVSPYNAWRIFGMLAFLLGIQLPRELAKLIKF